MTAKQQTAFQSEPDLQERAGVRGVGPEPLVALSRSAFERLLARARAPEACGEATARTLQLVDVDHDLEITAEPDAEQGVALAKAVYRFRRRREHEFGEDLFGDPVWDMLLDLYVAELTGRRVSVSSSCIASAVPITTALRWLRQLEERDIVRRDQDLGDKRRIYLRLSEESVRKMSALLHHGRGMMAPSRQAGTT